MAMNPGEQEEIMEPITTDRTARFKGTCDVCGEDITLEWDYANGIIDIGVEGDEPNVRTFTWIRHIGGPKPDCDRISSRVYAEDD